MASSTHPNQSLTADATAPDAVSSKTVYFFGGASAEGTREMRAVLGGKGANLAEMTNLGVPVPPGFTIACSACNDYLRERTVPSALREAMKYTECNTTSSASSHDDRAFAQRLRGRANLRTRASGPPAVQFPQHRTAA